MKKYKAMMSKQEGKQSTVTTAANAKINTPSNDGKYITYSAFAAARSDHNSDHFLIDTGENTQIVSYISLLQDIRSINPTHTTGIAGTSGRVTASQSGSVSIKRTTIDGLQKTIKLEDVLFVPEAGVNILAVSNISKDGSHFSGDDKNIKLTKKSKEYVITGTGANGLYKVKGFRSASLFAAPA